MWYIDAERSHDTFRTFWITDQTDVDGLHRVIHTEPATRPHDRSMRVADCAYTRMLDGVGYAMSFNTDTELLMDATPRLADYNRCTPQNQCLHRDGRFDRIVDATDQPQS